MTETGLVFLNFGHCDLFDICDLLFGIFGTPVFQQTAARGKDYGSSLRDSAKLRPLGPDSLLDRIKPPMFPYSLSVTTTMW